VSADPTKQTTATCSECGWRVDAVTGRCADGECGARAFEPSRASKRAASYERFGCCVRCARQRRGLTQAELASLIRLGRTSVTNIEAGRQRVLLHQAYDIAEALEVEVTELV
jgi:DNA-binding XRE family transcriptional regulator